MMRDVSSRKGCGWWSLQAASLAMVLFFGCGHAAAETGENAPPVPVSESSAGFVSEDELAPTLESNRQPLGPDPLVLPQWTPEESAAFDRGRPVNLGGGLWTAERYPLQPVPPWPVAPPTRSAPVPGVLGWDLLSQYGASRDWCVDPQDVIEAGRRMRLQDHLAAHARTGLHPVRLWVLGPDQSLGAALDDAALHRASFGEDQPGILAVVSVASPASARVIVPPALADQAGAWRGPVMARVAASAAPADQLDQLVLWLTLDAVRLPAVPAPTAGSDRQPPASPAAPAMTRPPRASQPWWWWLGTGLAVAIAAGLAWRRRRRPVSPMTVDEPAVWLDSERPTRLGGPHCGGSGAVMEW